jgi:hypothetical protein
MASEAHVRSYSAAGDPSRWPGTLPSWWRPTIRGRRSPRLGRRQHQ